MINDPTGNKPSLAEFMRHQGGLPGEQEHKLRTAAVEAKSKVTPGEHTAAMAFLAEEFSKLAQQQQEYAEGKRPSQSGTSQNSNAADQGSTKATDGQTTPSQAGSTQNADGQLLGPDGQPISAQTGQGTVEADLSLTPFGAIIGGEGAAAEELKKEASRKNQENNSSARSSSSSATSTSSSQAEGTPTTTPSAGSGTDNAVDGDGSLPSTDGQTGDDDTFTGKLPSWGPPNPPAPTFPPGFSLDSLTSSSVKDHMAILTALMARMAELISDAALEKMEANRAHTQKTNELNQASIQKSQEEQEAQLEKSNQASKVGTCVMVALAVASFALSAFAFLTGGALLPFIIATIGLAMMVVDQILSATGHTTLTETLFSPLMETVLPAIVEFFAGIFEQLLVAVGVAADMAQLIGNILGSIAAVAAIIVMFLAAKNLVGPLLSKLMGMLGSAAAKVAAKMAPNLARSAGAALGSAKSGVATRLGAFQGKVSEAMSKIGPSNPNGIYAATLDKTGDIGTAMAAKLDAVADNAAALSKAISQAQSATSTVGMATLTGASVASTTYDYLANLETAFIEFLMQMMGVTDEMMESITEMLKDAMQLSQEMMESALDGLAARHDVAIAIAQTMGKGV